MPTYAQENHPNQQRTLALQALAKNFVNKISPAYENAPASHLIASQGAPQIEDGSTLLFVPMVDKIKYSGDIYAIKQNGEMYLSLIDVIEVLELAIDFDEQDGIGQGWFLREDWQIKIDVDAGTIQSRGKQYEISDHDFMSDGPTVFARAHALEEWLDMEFDYDIPQQFIGIKTAYPLPAVARHNRRTRIHRGGPRDNVAKLPRHEVEPKLFDITAANVVNNLRYRRTHDGETTLDNSTNIRAEGQFLHHESYALVSSDNHQGLRSVRARLSKQSETGDLLGPLGARYYEMGDISGISVPLTGGSGHGLGFRLNNNPLVNSNFNTTNIEGDYLPGWDVELYRNGLRIGTQFIESDGYYQFQDVPLFAGKNDFELLFYGPQGEIRTETLSMPVTADLLRTQRNTYEISAQLNGESTYQRTQTQDDDKGKLDISARYNAQLGGNTLGTVGFRSRFLDGARRSFATAGLTSVMGGVIYDANFAVDDRGQTAADIGARRSFLGWDLAANAAWNTDEYKTTTATYPSILRLGAQAQRQFSSALGARGNILLSTDYYENANGINTLQNKLGLSQQYKNINLSNTLSHRKSDGGATNEDEIINAFSARAHFGKASIRAGVNYEIAPDNHVSRYYSQINYRHNTRTSTDLYLERNPVNSYSRGRLNLNYTHDYFRLSPFVEYDTDSHLYAGLNVNFSLYNHPGTLWPQPTSDSIMGRGLVTGFVYHDENGNMTFDEGEETLSKVALQSLNSKRRSLTDDSGYAVLRGVPAIRPTDIVIDENTLPDPYMVSGFAGVSVFPVAGQNPEFAFPVHMSGEVDGTLFIEDETGATRPYANKIIQLLPLDAPQRKIIETQAMFDGFFLFNKVPPGRYLMIPKERNMPNDANPVPELIEIGFDGTIVLDKDIRIKSQGGFVPYSVEYAEHLSTASAGVPTAILSNPSNAYRLDVKTSGKSELSSLLGALLYKRHAAPLLKGLTRLRDEPTTGQRTYSGAPEQLHQTCQALRQKNIHCQIRVLVGSNPDTPPLANTAQSGA